MARPAAGPAGAGPQQPSWQEPESLQQAKRPVTVLAGPYGHPLHPVLVTIPIGAWVASLVFDLASHLQVAGPPGFLVRGSAWLLAIGIIGALLAAMLGFLDLFAIPTGTRAFRIGLLHMSLNLAVVAAYAVDLVLRLGRLDRPGGVPSGLVALSAVALATLAVSGWLGGMLAYRYGVRVADERTQTQGFVQPQAAAAPGQSRANASGGTGQPATHKEP
jgi:uncharacterized membrane protein